MTNVRLLLDMNLSPSWSAYLRQAGFDAVHWIDVGAPTAPDVELLNWARANGCVVFTNDLDFSALLAMTRGRGPSVIQLRIQDLLPASAGAVVLAVLRDHAEAIELGAIVTVADQGTRVRVLPLT